MKVVAGALQEIDKDVIEEVKKVETPLTESHLAYIHF